MGGFVNVRPLSPTTDRGSATCLAQESETAAEFLSVEVKANTVTLLV
jgi:hypothetical protein